MRCTNEVCGTACPDCPRKWIVQPDTLDGDMEFFCFDTEAEARACFDRIERTNEYDGQRFKPKSAILFKPKEAST